MTTLYICIEDGVRDPFVFTNTGTDDELRALCRWISQNSALEALVVAALSLSDSESAFLAMIQGRP